MKGIGIKGVGLVPSSQTGAFFDSFLPTNIPDMSLWLSADRITAADGAGLAQWDDLSGLGNHCTQANPANRPIYSANGVNGKPEVAFCYIDLGTGILERFMAIPNTHVVTENNCSVFVVGRPTSKALTALYTVTVALEPGGTLLGWGGNYGAVVVNGVLREGTRLIHHQPGLSGLTSGAAVKVWNNQYSDSFGPGIANAQTGGIIGYAGPGSYRSYGTMSEVLVYNRCLTDAEVAQLWEYAKRKYGLMDVPSNQIIFDGDSLTTGYACLNWSNFPGQTWGLLGQDWKIYCVPVAGQTLVNMQADAAAEIDPLIDATLEHNVLVCWGGVLDVFFGATPAQTLINLDTYCTARQAAGWEVVVLTCLPSDYIGAADRATLNTGIRANWATFADALSDIAADTRIGDDGDNLNPLYYNNSDGNNTHMTQAGFSIVAQITAAAIATL